MGVMRDTQHVARRILSVQRYYIRHGVTDKSGTCDVKYRKTLFEQKSRQPYK